MHEMARLTEVANARFDQYLRRLGPELPCHRVEFSSRITTSWALIYYRRRLVRLSPYLFLLPPSQLHHGSHWRELDATLRHEAAHAATHARTGETGHSLLFHAHLRRLGVEPNGRCDLGPENVAFRYVYSCPTCATEWPRRAALKGNWSCGVCAPGRYDPTHRMVLKESLDPPWARLAANRAWMRDALAEAAGPAAPSLHERAPHAHAARVEALAALRVPR